MRAFPINYPLSQPYRQLQLKLWENMASIRIGTPLLPSKNRRNPKMKNKKHKRSKNKIPDSRGKNITPFRSVAPAFPNPRYHKMSPVATALPFPWLHTGTRTPSPWVIQLNRANSQGTHPVDLAIWENACPYLSPNTTPQSGTHS